MAKSVESQLVALTGVKRKPKEEDQEYYLRLLGGADKISDAQWEELSEVAQAWINDGLRAKKAQKPIQPLDTKVESEVEPPAKAKPEAKKPAVDDEDEPAPVKKKPAPVDEEDDEPAPKKKPEPVDEDEAPSAKKKPPVDEDEPAPKKKPAPEPEADEPAPKKVVAKDPDKVGIQTRIKQIVLKKPKISATDLFTKLDAEGFKTSMSTVQTVRSDFRHTLKFLVDEKLIEIEL